MYLVAILRFDQQREYLHLIAAPNAKYYIVLNQSYIVMILIIYISIHLNISIYISTECNIDIK